jgi:hypothetical protein
MELQNAAPLPQGSGRSHASPVTDIFFAAGQSIRFLLAFVPQHANPFLLEDLINLLIGENGIFMVTQVNDTVGTDI